MTKRKRLRYTVFNKTDGFYASPDIMTKKQADKFVKDFPFRYTKQGYYRTNKWEKIDPKDVILEIRPVIFSNKSKNKLK